MPLPVKEQDAGAEPAFTAIYNNCRENEYSIKPHKLDSVGATPTAATKQKQAVGR